MEPTVDFSEALRLAKGGHKIARKGWNGRNQWVRVFKAYNDKEFKVSEEPEAEGTLMDHLVLKNTVNQLIPWVPSQGDLFADDWVIADAPQERVSG